jgi:hypothetical protein
MSNYTVTDVLHTLFANAAALMEELSAANGSFSSQSFLRQLAQRNQYAYIELLQRCTAHPEGKPFNIAHQHIGKKLSIEALKLGYTRSEDVTGTETDIFGNPTGRVVYTRKSKDTGA